MDQEKRKRYLTPFSLLFLFLFLFPYPLSQNNYDYLIDVLKGNGDIFVFTLNPKLEVVTKNRGNRELTDWEKERMKHHYSIGINNSTFGEVIDNTDQTAKETAEVILDFLFLAGA